MAQDYYKHPSNYVWWVERNKLGIAQSTDGETFSGPSSVLAVRIYCTKRGDLFKTGTDILDDLNASSDIPGEFHEALFAKANEILYERSPEQYGTAQYWRDKYEGFIREAKRYANRERDARDIYGVVGDSY